MTSPLDGGWSLAVGAKDESAGHGRCDGAANTKGKTNES